ncbi:hypothetical protein LCGC14_1208140 [marine sediment metagenome]|uniref:Uncharacterized protein n=1 Tax=marine sediment metagenome TaxID=412755 RepID=A0A0F9LJA0_9ZZZZ
MKSNWTPSAHHRNNILGVDDTKRETGKWLKEWLKTVDQKKVLRNMYNLKEVSK